MRAGGESGGRGRRDTWLTRIGSFRAAAGKFQHVVLSGCGHHLHQDVPERLAELLVEFWSRNLPLDLSKIKKVGEV